MWYEHTTWDSESHAPILFHGGSHSPSISSFIALIAILHAYTLSNALSQITDGASSLSALQEAIDREMMAAFNTTAFTTNLNTYGGDNFNSATFEAQATVLLITTHTHTFMKSVSIMLKCLKMYVLISALVCFYVYIRAQLTVVQSGVVITYYITIVTTKSPSHVPTSAIVDDDSSYKETAYSVAFLSMAAGSVMVFVGICFCVARSYRQGNSGKHNHKRRGSAEFELGDLYQKQSRGEMDFMRSATLTHANRLTNAYSSTSSTSSNRSSTVSNYSSRSTASGQSVDFGGEQLSGAYHIPFGALKLESKPFARGGGGQIFKGHYRATKIAAKQVFSSMDANLEEFEREVGAIIKKLYTWD